jgi:RimJ/RimL family protein N-acetyltransferase
MLEGKLVRLRPLEPEDLEPAAKWMNDPEVTYFLGMRYPISRVEEERWLREASTSNNFAGGLRLAIETKEGMLLGSIDLRNTSPEDRRASLGVVIGEPEYWSKGYGADAIMTVLRFGFGQMNLNRVSLDLFEFNERALACYRKCGFREEGRLRQDRFKHGRYWDAIVMGILREEFEALEEAP